MKIVFSNHCQTKNVGDLFATPLKYYRFPGEHKQISFNRLSSYRANCDMVLLGGGDLL